MKKILFFFLGILILVLTPASGVTACGPAKPQSPLAENRAKWQAQGIQHYRFNLSISCFCPFQEQMPLTIEVQNGKVVSISARDGEDVTPFLESYSRSDTIDKLFNIIASAEGSADELEIEYNPTYGFPSLVWIDYMKNAVDPGLPG